MRVCARRLPPCGGHSFLARAMRSNGSPRWKTFTAQKSPPRLVRIFIPKLEARIPSLFVRKSRWRPGRSDLRRNNAGRSQRSTLRRKVGRRSSGGATYPESALFAGGYFHRGGAPELDTQRVCGAANRREPPETRPLESFATRGFLARRRGRALSPRRTRGWERGVGPSEDP